MNPDAGARARTGSDAPPTPRPSSLRDPPVALLVAATLGAAPFVGHIGVGIAVPFLVLVSFGCSRRGEVPGRNAAIVAALGLATTFLPNGWWAWPAPILLATAAALRPAWRGPDGIVPWLRRGSLTRSDFGWIVAVAAASGVALVAWKALRRPDIADLTGGLPSLPTWLLLAGGIAWAALNAFGEEAIFRGALFAALERALGPRIALVVQAIPFGLVHYRGFPRGLDGVLLAALYGVMLGGIRRKTGGLLAPILAHTVADAVILALLLAAR